MKHPLIHIALVVFSMLSTCVYAEPTSTATTKAKRPWYLFSEVIPEISVVQSVDLSLQTGAQQFAYPKDGVGFLLPQVGFLYPVTRVGDFAVDAIARLGYGQRVVTARTVGRALADEDLYRLHWLPLSLSTRLSIGIPGINFLRPTLTVGAGSQLFYQTGNTAPMSAWVPFAFITPAIMFVENAPAIDWWGGFTFGVTFSRDLSGTNTANSIGYNLSVNLIL